MRGLFSIVGLVLVVAVVGWLAKKQLAAVRAAPPALMAPAPGVPPTGLTGPLPASVQPPHAQGPAQIQQQYKQALEQAMQQPRPMPDDVK